MQLLMRNNEVNITVHMVDIKNRIIKSCDNGQLMVAEMIPKENKNDRLWKIVRKDKIMKE